MPKQRSSKNVSLKLVHTGIKKTSSRSEVRINDKLNEARYIGVKLKISSKTQTESITLQPVRNLSSAKIKIFIAGGEDIDKKISDANDSLLSN